MAKKKQYSRSLYAGIGELSDIAERIRIILMNVGGFGDLLKAIDTAPPERIKSVAAVVRPQWERIQEAIAENVS